MPRIALLTVGSTEFTQLVNAALTTEVLEALEHQGYTRFVVQHGKSRLSREALDAVAAAGERHECGEGALQVELHGYMNDIETRMRDAELVISHAGAGSILAALRGPALRPLHDNERADKKLVIVPNDTLMDSHQSDLADELGKNGWAVVASPSTLAQTVAELAAPMKVTGKSSSGGHMQTFPPFDASRIRSILDEAVGFV